jgi:hypothetical protein
MAPPFITRVGDGIGVRIPSVWLSCHSEGTHAVPEPVRLSNRVDAVHDARD